MTETIESKLINDYLKLQAKVPLSDKPLFRLVYSDDQYEHRMITEGPNKGQVQLLPKYPWIQMAWVFEQWYPPELVEHKDLPFTSEGSYEPLYVFQDKNGKTLPLNQKVIELLVFHIMRPASSEALIKSRLIEEQDEMDKLEDQYFDNNMDISSDIMSNLHFGEGIIVPSNYDITSPNLRRFN